jgi:type IV pilus assembly protein PilX
MRNSSANERGVSLLVVMVVLLLSMLLVLWASRTALFNEMVTGNDSDYQRAHEAAHAMLRDAEFDIENQRPDGSACGSAGYTGCRRTAVVTVNGLAVFPESTSDFEVLESSLAGQIPSCRTGICIAAHVDIGFWTKAAGVQGLDAMKKVAATYGQYTGAVAGDIGNPLLKTGSDAAKAWYWVEVLPYDTSSAIAGGAAHAFAPDSRSPYVYRITAIAQGLKKGTQAVVQSTFVWRKAGS